MLCTNCGNEVPAGYKFCPSCGTPVSENSAVVSAASFSPTPQNQQPAGYVDERQYTMQTLDRITSYFGAVADKYELFHKLAAEVQDRSEKPYVGTWILTGILLIVSSILIGWANSSSSGWSVLGWLVGLLGALATFVFIIISLIDIPLYIKNKKRLPIAKQELDDTGNYLARYYKDFGYCPIAFEMTEPEILANIAQIITMGRATNFPAALAVLKQDQVDAELLAQAERTAKAAEETAKNSRKAARSAAKAADYASLTYWFK